MIVQQIMGWADAYRRRTGKWPTSHSGPIPEEPDLTWGGLAATLYLGYRGLPKRARIRQLLAKHRGVRNPAAPPRLTTAQVLAWADRHHAETGRWPAVASGPALCGEPDWSFWRLNCRSVPPDGQCLCAKENRSCSSAN